MKKLIVGLLAAFLMSTGLVAFSASTASAAPCPYSGCTNTNTVGVGFGQDEFNRRGNLKKKGTGIIAARLDGTGTNVTPVGRVYLSVKKQGSTNIKFTAEGNVDQRGKIRFAVPKLKRTATWLYSVEFRGNEGNGWNNSRDIGSFTF